MQTVNHVGQVNVAGRQLNIISYNDDDGSALQYELCESSNSWGEAVHGKTILILRPCNIMPGEFKITSEKGVIGTIQRVGEKHYFMEHNGLCTRHDVTARLITERFANVAKIYATNYRPQKRGCETDWPNTLAELFRDYFNNFLSVGAFADYHGIEDEEAEIIVEQGRIQHEYEYEQFKARALAGVAV